ncbi:hypothetical protein [Paenilisteria rocourtiae]|uniref:Uncharacterized protein n=1 Tax=Listeria rocourtiae TaxID=647910 RepID=A0A4R6ZR13_9LIST|nr:hypothetical protein [Listeria rocourtiae]EUJ44439.1 hypothetical protein PROCOU_14088 [Listeria rocourtiae FSL F6-920]TDR55077.1 hypothetical protein DFP96_1013 [Listeria rocourtiae]
MKRILDIDIAHEKALKEDYERSMTLVLDELKRLYRIVKRELGAYYIMKYFEHSHLRMNRWRQEKFVKAWIDVDSDEILRNFMDWIDGVRE